MISRVPLSSRVSINGTKTLMNARVPDPASFQVIAGVVLFFSYSRSIPPTPLFIFRFEYFSPFIFNAPYRSTLR